MDLSQRRNFLLKLSRFQPPPFDGLLSRANWHPFEESGFSRLRSYLSISSPASGNRVRLDRSSRPDPNSRSDPGTPDPDLGDVVLRLKSGVDHGLGISRQYRPGIGDVSVDCRFYVPAPSTGALRNFLRLELPDQNCPAFPVADSLFLLVSTGSERAICRSVCLLDPRIVDPTADPISRPVSSERF